MNTPESTQRIEVVKANGNGDGSHGTETDAWSFGTRKRLFTPEEPSAHADLSSKRSEAANEDDASTSGQRPAPDTSDLQPVAPRRPYFGRRAFSPLYQWEGVVEEVNGGSFRARLVPFENGHADVSRVEFAEFDYDDLADESDHALVEEDAVFYWTVGRSRNAAGTVMNTSLVRFQRLPPPTAYQTREAGREAAAILADLGDD